MHSSNVMSDAAIVCSLGGFEEKLIVVSVVVCF